MLNVQVKSPTADTVCYFFRSDCKIRVEEVRGKPIVKFGFRISPSCAVAQVTPGRKTDRETETVALTCSYGEQKAQSTVLVYQAFEK